MAEEKQKAKNLEDLSADERRSFYRAQMGHDEEFDKARISDLKRNYKLTAANYLRGEKNSLGDSGLYAGKIGYQEFMTSDDANKIRKDAYDQKKQEYQELGIPDMPVIVDPYINEVATKATRGAIKGMDLNELEKLVSEMSPGAKLAGKDFIETRKALDKKMEDYFVENAKPMELSEEDQEILGAEAQYRGVLFNAYQKGAALKLTQEHYFDEENSYLDKFYEQFKPKEEKKESEKKSE